MVRKKKGKESKDVVMAPVKEGKVKKTINKSKRRKAPKPQPAVAESRKQRRKRIAASVGGTGETAEQLRGRQVVEWKEMKAKVAQLKKEKQKLPRRGSKEQKQDLAQKIRQLQEDMQVRHLAELKAAGLEGTGPQDDDMDL
ncbi:unnamed protein product [Durusdinium trenchii]|uniref:Uncharacterized protein n=2 Tax=Durusdinium trenchii TaxID=1381693 RepID=A0ABP0KEU5_9DINO